MITTHRQKKPHTKVTTIKMKPKHSFSSSLLPPKSTETNKTLLTGGSNKNEIKSTSEKLLLTSVMITNTDNDQLNY